jgi:hypothetical protein
VPPPGREMGQLARKLEWKEKWTGISFKAGKATRGSNNHRLPGQFTSRLSDRLTGYLFVWAVLGHFRGCEYQEREIPAHSDPVSPGLGSLRDRGPGCPPPGLHG